MAENYNVTVIGATGMVGEAFLGILADRRFPLGKLRLLASSRSAGKRIQFDGREITVEELSEATVEGCDLAFISATDEISKKYAPIAAKAGAVVIDDSGVWRMHPDVPLVIPEVNPDDVHSHKGILAIPNCSTTPVVMTLWPVHQRNPVKRIIASTYQSVTGTGRAAAEELRDGTSSALAGKAIEPKVYKHRIAFNLIPEIGSVKEDGYTSEELKMRNETRKIMHAPDIAIATTCVRVPVFVSHSASVFAEFTNPITPEEFRCCLKDQPGVVVEDDLPNGVYPRPLESAGKDPVFAGRIRKDLSTPNGIAYWVVGDNLRKGAALNALQIAELMIARGVI
jgi:aspartate-semialdehyde dehydrogenase